MTSVPMADDLLAAQDELAEYEDREPAAVQVDVNYGQTVGAVYGGQIIHQYFRQCVEYLELKGRHILDCRRGYITPPLSTVEGVPQSWETALQRLTDTGGLVLLGERGAGRHTTAVNLLAATGVPLHQSRAATAETPELPQIVPTQPQAQLMHLEWYAEPGESFAAEFAAYRDRLHAKGSYIILTATRERWKAAGGGSDATILMLHPPDPSQLVRAKLSDLTALTEEQIKAAVDQSGAVSPEQASHLAQCLSDSIGAKDPVGAALSAYRNWRSELAAWFTAHTDVWVRSFLIATALLHGCPAQRVLNAAHELVRMMEKAEPGISLRFPGIAELATKAHVHTDSGVAKFAQDSYATAVLDFVLDDRPPEFERQLWAWAASLPGDVRTGAEREVAQRVARTALDTCVRRSSMAPLASLLARWSGSSALHHLLAEAFTVAALSSEIGALTRDKLYRWAATWGNPVSLRVIATVCGREFADFYPSMALRRLGVLAGRGRHDLQDALVEALTSLWSRPPLRGYLISQLSTWLADKQRRGVAIVVCRRIASAPDGEAIWQRVDASAYLVTDLASSIPDQESWSLVEELLGKALTDEAVTASLERIFAGAVAASAAPARTVGVIRSFVTRWCATYGLRSSDQLRQRLLGRLHRFDTLWLPQAAGSDMRMAANDR